MTHKRHHAYGVADPAYDANRWSDTIFPGRHHAAFWIFEFGRE
jgi:hypothetical protein